MDYKAGMISVKVLYLKCIMCFNEILMCIVLVCMQEIRSVVSFWNFKSVVDLIMY